MSCYHPENHIFCLFFLDSANGFDILEKIETVDFRTGKRVQFSDEGDEIPRSNPPPMNDYNFGHELLKLEDINHR